ncbi:MAG TPA: hypothetical protein PKC39_14650 [Ferruginibacter sp.]|nr:hypothetical protein [Ferruginibacter sp.]HMP22196.1 hypothetical protein [Ferruginibacter sp.]
MSQKFRLKDVEVTGYYFPSHEGLLWHSGDFWYNEEKVKKVCNNGSMSLLLAGSKIGVKKLRKEARLCKIKLLKETLPF